MFEISITGKFFTLEILRIYAYVTKLKNLLVLVDMLLGESAARFVRFFSNGMDCGVPVVVID
jgi:hypothetical protein